MAKPQIHYKGNTYSVVKKKAKKPRRRGSAKAVAAKAFMDRRGAQMLRSLADPCNAPLESGVYPGQMGFISRMSNVFTLSTGATESAFLATVIPTAAQSFGLAAVAGSTPITPVSGQTLVPGASFINFNARSARCLGACYEFFTNATPLNSQGTFHYGVVPASVIINGASSIQAVSANLQHMSKVNADAYELKWRPGSKDEFYATPNNQISATEWDDINALVLCGTGFPINSTVTLKVTIIWEWLPTTNIGLQTPASNNPSPHRASQLVAHLDAHHPNWWAGKAGEATKFVWNHGGSQLASFATQVASQQAARSIMRTVGSAAEGAALALL